MDSNNFIVYIKVDDIYEDFAKDVETRFGTSNYELYRQLPKVKNEKGIGVTKNELGEKNMKGFVGLRAKTYNYLIDYDSEDKKQKTQKVCHKRRKFEYYKNCKQLTLKIK